MRDENQALIRRVVELLFNRKLIGLIDDLYAPDCRSDSPEGLCVGQDALRALFEKYERAFPGFRIEIRDLLSSGDRIVLQYTFHGVHLGDLAGYPPTGRRLHVPGVLIARVANSRIVEQSLYWDSLGPVRQLWLASVVERQSGSPNLAPPVRAI